MANAKRESNGRDLWWERELDFMDDMLDDAPVSSSWRKKLGAWSWSRPQETIGGDIKTDRLKAVQYRLARSANVVRNSTGEHDKSLNIAWSDGTQTNTCAGDTVFISPDLLMKEKRGSLNEDKAIDALTGQVLVAGALKRTMHPDCEEQARHDMDGLANAARIVWRGLETAVARQDVLVTQNWPGAAQYFKRHADQSVASKEELQKALNALRPSVELAAAALAWNIQFPHNKVSVPKSMKVAVSSGAEVLNAEFTADQRYEICRRVAQVLKDRLLEEPSPPSPPQPRPNPDPKGEGEQSESSQGQGQGEPGDAPENEADTSEDKSEGESQEEPEAEGEGEGGEVGSEADISEGDSGGEPEEESEGGSEEQGETDGEQESGDATPDDQKPEGPPPEVTDSSLFGEQVDNNTVEKDALPAPVDVAQAQHEGGEIAMPDGMEEVKEFEVCFVEERGPTAYKEAVRRMASPIRALQGALRFRNNDTSMWNRGCTSGDLDDTSLHKLAFNERNPAIWERRELHGQPKVAVGLLLDQSGSMDGSKIDACRDICIAMAEALKRTKGVDLMLLGHSTGCFVREERTTTVKKSGVEASLVTIVEFYTKQHRNPYAIANARSGGSNYDSYAMDYSVRKMLRDYPDHPRRILFVVSDGQPCGGGKYGGASAMKHMRQVCEWGRRRNVQVFGIGIGGAYTPDKAELMYGKGNSVVIRDVFSSLPILTAMIHRVCAKRSGHFCE